VIRSKWRECALVGGVALAGLTGCNLVVGAGDYVVEKSDGATLADGATQTESGTSPGDDASDDGSSTTTPDSGTDGGVVSTGDAGEGGVTPFDSGVPPTCGQTIPTTSADFQALVTACVMASNCDPEFFDVNVSDCVTNDYLAAVGVGSSAALCLSTITSCAGYYTCMGERNTTTAECSGNVGSGSCSGTVAKTCFIDSEFTGSLQNCAMLGGTCAVHTDSNSDQLADCKVLATCSNGDEDTHCSGTKLYTCYGGVGYGKDCANLGATCKTVNGYPQCVFNETACSTQGTTCAGADATECSVADQSLDLKCGRAGGTCVNDVSAAACVAPGCEPPSTNGCLEECASDGVTADVCVGGQQIGIDCSKYGFTACDDTLSDPNETNAAFCY
jgi:hypothetical protein